jgi:membrane glycosyltransferase
VAIPLILAAPTSVYLSRIRAGQRLRRDGFLLVPEECNGSVLLHDLNNYQRTDREGCNGESPVLRAVFDPVINQLHRHLGISHHGGVKATRLHGLRERFYHKGHQSLTREELTILMRDRESLSLLHHAVWQAGPDTLWGRLLEQRQRLPVSSALFEYNTRSLPELPRRQTANALS